MEAKDPETSWVVAVCNQKGGVGKTTTVYHLAWAALKRGLRVLVIDADPQGNITSALTDDRDRAGVVGLADALSTRVPEETLSTVIMPGRWDGANLDLVPTSGDLLAGVRDELIVAGAGRESRLREQIPLVASAYDLVLVDCAPAIDPLTINALTAADAALVVTQPKLFSLDGLGRLLDTIQTVRGHYNPRLTVAGILVNQHEERTVSAAHWAAELDQAAKERGLRVLDPPIPKRVAISDSLEAGEPLDDWPVPDAAALAGIYSRHMATLMGEGER